jgi:NAD kinase/nicotinic acid mononucleotide adenylyltransferase
MTRVAVYQGTFDPPTNYHRWVVEELLRERADGPNFDRVVVSLCGPNPTRGTVPDSRSIHRATMADLNFAGLPRVTVDLDDLEAHRFCPPGEVADKFRGADVWHVVSAAWVRDGGDGRSKVHGWSDGPRMWETEGFVVLHEPGEPVAAADLPPRHLLVRTPIHMPGNAVRQMLNVGEAVDQWVFPAVLAYIRRHDLYRDVPPTEAARLSGLVGRPPRLRVIADEYNPTALGHADALRGYTSDDPEVIVGIGGDGTMLRAIRRHWRDRRPFFGINTGGLGFLLNGRQVEPFWERELLVYQLPLLRVDATFMDGTTADGVAFNDTWVERATGQTAWVKVTVNGEVRVPQLIGDGVLVATAAGSSSYARAMGATPVPLNTGVLILVGSNVLKPAFWRPVILPLDAEIVLETVDPVRRPLLGYLDGEPYRQPLRRLAVRVSRTAAAELAFLPEHDPVRKLGFLQFPPEVRG